MNIVIYDTKNYKITDIVASADKIETLINVLKTQNILNENTEYKVFAKTDAYNGLDIRAVKEDGSVMSLKEQIKESVITLNEDEKLENGQILKLEEIERIEKGIDKLDKNKKIEEIEGKKLIVEKTMEEKLKDSLITEEEYDETVVNIRKYEYQNKIDGERAEILDEVLKTLLSKGFIDKKYIESLKSIDEKREKIKRDNPKANKIL